MFVLEYDLRDVHCVLLANHMAVLY